MRRSKEVEIENLIAIETDELREEIRKLRREVSELRVSCEFYVWGNINSIPMLGSVLPVKTMEFREVINEILNHLGVEFKHAPGAVTLEKKEKYK